MNNEINIAWISNIFFEPYLSSSIISLFNNIGAKVVLNYVSYGEIVEHFNTIKNADCICVCMNFEEMYPNAFNDVASAVLSVEDIGDDILKKCRILREILIRNSNVPVIWFGFEDYYNNLAYVRGNIPMFKGAVDKANLKLQNLFDKEIYIDLKRLIAEVGKDKSYDHKGKCRWNAPYSKFLVEHMAKEVYKQYLIHQGYTKKCIVLDCDNVLWGGILSEDGIEQIKLGYSCLGRPFLEFQRFLLSLYHCGAILTVCSKNDEEDVLKVFREHSGMILKEEHIACFAVNWERKTDNIIRISEELNIGLDSMVFIDDSKIEVEAIKLMLPEVTSLLYNPQDTYFDLSCFNIGSEIDLRSVNKRMQTYRTNKDRITLRKECHSNEEYLKELCIRVDIHASLPTEYTRIVELTQRTNKCTNGRRYTIDKLKTKLQEGRYLLFTVSVSDKFSDLGIVGAIGLQDDCLDLFALSCRALGRGIESDMLSLVKEMAVKECYFEHTGKNDNLISAIKLQFCK